MQTANEFKQKAVKAKNDGVDLKYATYAHDRIFKFKPQFVLSVDFTKNMKSAVMKGGIKFTDSVSTFDFQINDKFYDLAKSILMSNGSAEIDNFGEDDLKAVVFGFQQLANSYNFTKKFVTYYHSIKITYSMNLISPDANVHIYNQVRKTYNQIQDAEVLAIPRIRDFDVTKAFLEGISDYQPFLKHLNTIIDEDDMLSPRAQIMKDSVKGETMSKLNEKEKKEYMDYLRLKKKFDGVDSASQNIKNELV